MFNNRFGAVVFALGLFFFISGFSPIMAYTLENPYAGIEFWVPDHWPRDIDGADISLESPDSEVSLVFTVLEAQDLESAMTEVGYRIAEAVGHFDLNPPEEIPLNGLTMVEFSGTAMDGGMLLSISLVPTPTGKFFTIFAFGTIHGVERHGEEVAKIAQSIKPKSSSSGATITPPDDNFDPAYPLWGIGESIFVDGDNVILRGGPGTRNKQLAKLGYEDYGVVVANGPIENLGGRLGEHRWIKVKITSRNGIEGWVFGLFIRGEGCSG